MPAVCIARQMMAHVGVRCASSRGQFLRRGGKPLLRQGAQRVDQVSLCLCTVYTSMIRHTSLQYGGITTPD